VDSTGNVFVADTGNNRIQKFDKSGNFLLTFGTQGSGNGQFSLPFGVAVDSTGNIFVADAGNNRIQKFDKSGNFLLTFGTQGSGNGQFNSPEGIAVDSTGNIFVADTSNNRVQKFDNNGNFLLTFGTQGSGNGQFNSPKGVAVDSTGNVFVADTSNDRVQVFFPAILVPSVTDVTPKDIPAGSPDTPITITGNNFLPSSQVFLDTYQLSVISTSPHKLTSVIPAKFLTKPSTANIRVVNPLGGSASKPAVVVVQSVQMPKITVPVTPAPTISKVSGQLQVTVTLANIGNAPATGVKVTAALLNSTATVTPVPITVGTIAAGQQVTVILNFPTSAAASGTKPFLGLNFTSTAGGSGTAFVRCAPVP
jgi:hypothetical protein